MLKWGQAQAAVDHRDVVAVLEAGRDADGVYIIQERVEGATLERTLAMLRKSRRTLHPGAALSITERVLSALQGLQASPASYHGDLDTGEVLLGYDGAVKVGDQRLSDLVSVAGGSIDVDGAAEDREAAGPGPRGDAYAFALVSLEMMLGHPVWRSPTMSVDDALKALVDFAPVAQLDRRLAEDLGRWLQPCLARDPAARPDGFSALARSLAEMLSRHPARGNPPSLGPFIELVSPPPVDADAPTRMATAAALEAISVPPERRATFDAASVIITPEILAQAEAAYRARDGRPNAAPASDGRTEGPVDSSTAGSDAHAGEVSRTPRPRGPTLEGRSVPVDPPRAPSAMRERAASVPNVAAKAAAYAAGSLRDAHWSRWWPYGLAIAAAMSVVWLLAGSAERTIQLQLTSDPSPATVFVDGVRIGKTPLSRPLEVSANQIQLRFEKEGFESYQVTIGTQETELRYEAPLRAAQ